MKNIKELDQTVDAYNAIVKDYSARWTNDPRMNEQILKFISYLPIKDQVLDVGCGTGRDIRFLLEQNVNSIGIDLCPAMIEEARRNVPNGNFLVRNMLETRFLAESFNGIWACASVIHLPRKYLLDVLAEFHRILKPNGVLYLSLQEGQGSKYAKDGRYFVYYNRSEIVDYLSDAGFKIIETASNESHKNTFNEKITIKWLNYWTRKLS